MKLFEKPWLEIININLNDIVVTSPNDTNVGDPDYEGDVAGGTDNQ